MMTKITTATATAANVVPRYVLGGRCQMGNPYERECGAKEREMQAKGLAGADFTRGISSLSLNWLMHAFSGPCWLPSWTRRGE